MTRNKLADGVWGLVILLTLSLALWGCAGIAIYNVLSPPDRYATGPVGVQLIVTDPEDVARLCKGKLACASTDILVMPPPHPAASDYEALLHHELAHVRGWDAAHAR